MKSPKVIYDAYDEDWDNIPMVQSFDGAWVPLFQHQPCGSTAEFDGNHSYRCELCCAVVGSIAQPQHCKDEMKKYENWAKLGGKDWDYFAEAEEYECSSVRL